MTGCKARPAASTGNAEPCMVTTILAASCAGRHVADVLWSRARHKVHVRSWCNWLLQCSLAGGALGAL